MNKDPEDVSWGGGGSNQTPCFLIDREQHIWEGILGCGFYSGTTNAFPTYWLRMHKTQVYFSEWWNRSKELYLFLFSIVYDTVLFEKDFKILIYVYVYMWHECRSLWRPEEGGRPLELEMQIVVSLPMWVLGRGSPARAVSIFHCWAISPAWQLCILLKNPMTVPDFTQVPF